MPLYAARQPILNAQKELFGYELLFRDGVKNVFPYIDDNQATSKMVAGLQFNLGLEELTQNKPGFIKFTQETLLEGYPLALPPEHLVIEILETVKPGKKLLACCEELKQKGYTIALDDYEHQLVWKHFYPLTDIIKIDYQLTSLAEIKQIIEAISPFPQIKLLAEKVETIEEFNQAKDLGFSYFQGYFFSKPEVITSSALEAGQMTLLNLMSEIASDDFDVNKITQVFESDVSLSFKLLRYAQSPFFKRTQVVENLKQAIVLLGQDELRRFVSVLFSAQITSNKPTELSVMAMTRAKFCENLCINSNRITDKSSAFLVGMLSLVDALLDTSLNDLLDKLPLSDSIRDALLEQKGSLAPLLACCPYAERGDWQQLEGMSNQLNIEIDNILMSYSQAMIWSTERVSASL